MTVTVIDYIGGKTTTEYTGDEAQVEAGLRRAHPGASAGVGPGELKTLLFEIGRLPFVLMKVEGVGPGRR